MSKVLKPTKKRKHVTLVTLVSPKQKKTLYIMAKARGDSVSLLMREILTSHLRGVEG